MKLDGINELKKLSQNLEDIERTFYELKPIILKT